MNSGDSEKHLPPGQLPAAEVLAAVAFYTAPDYRGGEHQFSPQQPVIRPFGSAVTLPVNHDRNTRDGDSRKAG